MTSATGPRRHRSRASAGLGGGSVRRAARRGFTLLELVLAISVLLLLAGVVVVGLAGTGRVRDLEEGTLRFEAALRMARADACGRGRRLCLVLRDPEGGFQVLWEPEPLADPGMFVPYGSSTWPDRLPTGLIEVTGLEMTGPSVYRMMGIDSSPFRLEGFDEETTDVLMFHADGVCDSALVELASTDPLDARRAVVLLDGRTGRVESRILTPTELETYYEERAAEIE